VTHNYLGGIGLGEKIVILFLQKNNHKITTITPIHQSAVDSSHFHSLSESEVYRNCAERIFFLRHNDKKQEKHWRAREESNS